MVVDWTRCDGHGACHALAPELIALDEWGFPIVADTPLHGEILAHARRAAQGCPALALRLLRNDSRGSTR
jgi:ferredoxin